MAQSLVNFRMDAQLKSDMEHVCRELGMNMTTAFTIFAKKVVRENRIPFDVSVDPFYSSSNLTALNASIQQLQTGQTVTKSIEELEALADG
ncbi:MAG: type II toxin-antitoxin system RelB/DinJ family antitoxin [bacterium]|nr:type II toxin-antitoxin system RelB/DinJ family antitoxin [bacterium]